MIFMENKNILLSELDRLEKSDKAVDLFKAMDIILRIGDEEILVSFITKNHDILMKNDSIRFMSNHIDFYIGKEKYFEALNVLEKYQEEPFINLTTEDFMNELHSKLLNYIYPKRKKSEFTDDDLIGELFSNNEDKFLHSIKYLSDVNVRKYLPVIEKVLLSNVKYRFKILLQFVLIEQGIDKKICVKKDDGDVFYFVPNQTILPFQTVEYKLALKYIESLNESPSIIENAVQLMNMIEVRVFPFSFLKRYNSAGVSAEIIVFLTKKLLLEEPSLIDLEANTEIDSNELNDIIDELTMIIS